MKQCPNCRGLELYEDSVTHCPYCGSLLVPYQSTGRSGQRRQASPENRYANTTPISPTQPSTRNQTTGDPVFETRNGNKYHFHGMVVGVRSSQRYASMGDKWGDALFHSQPIQYSNPIYETTIRIEEISQTHLPDQMRSIVYYGDLQELIEGDEVEIDAVLKGGLLIAKTIRIHDTGMLVRSNGQMSSTSVIILTVSIALLIGIIILSLLNGGLVKLFNAFVNAIVTLVLTLAHQIPLTVIVVGLVLWFVFRRRRH